MRQVRQEVVQKLKFQNSFDTGPKPRLPKAKDHDKAQPTQVRVAEYRTSKEAQAKLAELQKKGVKAHPQNNQRLQRDRVYRLQTGEPRAASCRESGPKAGKKERRHPQTQNRIALPLSSRRKGSAAPRPG